MIDRASLASDNVSLQQELPEAEATNLLAHGDFIQNKVKAANELGRQIGGEGQLSFIRDLPLRAHQDGDAQNSKASELKISGCSR